MAAWQLAKALYTADRRGLARFVSMQNHYNLAYREEEREIIPLCLEEGLSLVPWSPLARGFLAGSRTRDGAKDTARARSDEYADRLYFRPEDFDVLEAAVAVAKERGVKPAQVALAWVLSRPGVAAPIVGATRLEHLDDAATAVDLRLTDEEVARLEAPYRPHPILGHEQPTPREVAARGSR
jgi:aryl-alcohol dehydrogenase (NADP+)